MKQINTSFYEKTAILYEIAKPGSDCIYYLPRPRRFGKSLMISTLKALFQGRRELFRGLKIERTDAAFGSSLLNFVGGHCRARGASPTSASTTIRRSARSTRSEWKPRRIDFQQTGREV